MKTKTLMLWSLACGFAIMAAGAVFLLQLTTTDELEPAVPLGEPVSVGDMVVTVGPSTEAGGTLEIPVSIGGTADDDPTDEFRLIASGRPLEIADTTCGPSATATSDCEISFDVSLADGTSRVLFYDRGDDGARWIIAD